MSISTRNQPLHAVLLPTQAAYNTIAPLYQPLSPFGDSIESVGDVALEESKEGKDDSGGGSSRLIISC